MDETTTPLFTVEMINKAVEAMVKAQDRVSKTVAQVIVMALWASNANKDPEVANTLVRNIRKGIRKQVIIDLLQANGNLAYVSGSFVFFDAKHTWTEEEVKVYKLAAANWENYKKPEAEAKIIDAVQALEELVAKLEKKHAKKEVEHDEAIIKIKALLGSLKAEELVG